MCDLGALRTDRKGLELVIRWFLSTWNAGDSCSSTPGIRPGERKGCDLKESRDKQEREKQMQSVWKGVEEEEKCFVFTSVYGNGALWSCAVHSVHGLHTEALINGRC